MIGVCFFIGVFFSVLVLVFVGWVFDIWGIYVFVFIGMVFVMFVGFLVVFFLCLFICLSVVVEKVYLM